MDMVFEYGKINSAEYKVAKKNYLLEEKDLCWGWGKLLKPRENDTRKRRNAESDARFNQTQSKDNFLSKIRSHLTGKKCLWAHEGNMCTRDIYIYTALYRAEHILNYNHITCFKHDVCHIWCTPHKIAFPRG